MYIGQWTSERSLLNSNTRKLVICFKYSGDACKNVGVIDYAIASPEYLKHITNFRVLEFSKLLSDVHCPIYIFIDHVKQYSCMRSSPNIIGNDNVDKNHAGGKILKMSFFLKI
jgi:hypothetical protein